MSLNRTRSEKDHRRRAVIARDGEICAECGTTENLTIDHIVPRAHGGNDAIVNLQLLCEPCNHAKGDRLDPADRIPERLRVSHRGFGFRAKVRAPKVKSRDARHLPGCDDVFCMFGCPVFHDEHPEMPAPTPINRDQRPKPVPSLTPLRREDGETWETYARRLERRIKEQRDHIERLTELRADDGNRADRKRIRALEQALGQMTLRWENQRAATQALVDRERERGVA